jgi:hypothetical protein
MIFIRAYYFDIQHLLICYRIFWDWPWILYNFVTYTVYRPASWSIGQSFWLLISWVHQDWSGTLILVQPTDITRTQYTKYRLWSASRGWASNARNMERPLILNKLIKKCITLVSLYWYTMMHGQQNIWMPPFLRSMTLYLALLWWMLIVFFTCWTHVRHGTAVLSARFRPGTVLGTFCLKNVYNTFYREI